MGIWNREDSSFVHLQEGCDSGGDNIELYRYFLRKNVDFIVRPKSRGVISWKRRLGASA